MRVKNVQISIKTYTTHEGRCNKIICPTVQRLFVFLGTTILESLKNRDHILDLENRNIYNFVKNINFFQHY